MFNHQPYDGSDIAWNGLRLAKTLHKKGEDVKIWLNEKFGGLKSA